MPSTTAASSESRPSAAVVTGAGGFVGANLVRRLLREGVPVHVLLKPGHEPWRLAGLSDRIHVHAVALSDAAGLRRVLSSVRPGWVFHLAVHGAYPHQTDRRAMLETNVTGLVNVVEAAEAAGVDGFVNAGSSSEYGYVDHPASESERLEPNSDYAVTKAFGTQFCRYVARGRGLPIVTLRLYSVYGPWEAPTRFVPTLAVRGLSGELPPLVDPRTARDFVYVEDVCDAFLEAARAARARAGAVYNVGSGTQTSIGEAVEIARRVLAIPGAPCWGAYPARSWDTVSWVADVRAIREELGWRASHTFEEGFVETVRWLKRPRGAVDAPPLLYFA